MAQFGVSHKVTFDAWSAGSRLPGDAANISVQLSQDGAKGVASTNAPAEILKADNSPSGRYQLTLTANEAAYNTTRVMPDSVTSGVICPDTFILRDQLRGARAVTITVTEADTTPIADVSVAIYDSTQTNVVALCETDAAGVARILNTTSLAYLDDGSYKIVCSKTGVNFPNPTSLTVDGAETVSIEGEVISPSTATAGYQTISGTALRGDGTPYVSGKVVFATNIAEQTVDGVSASPEEWTAEIDADDGTWEIQAQCGLSVVGKLLDDGNPAQMKTFTVTDAAAAAWSTY